mmetsp:Transcript_420/g.734  ORF Transcript_420/g.734 Transcript_420/m.734 type:complete len:328 (-) Transcript_420:1717-2700(-)
MECSSWIVPWSDIIHFGGKRCQRVQAAEHRNLPRRRPLPIELQRIRSRDGGVGWVALNRLLVERDEVDHDNCVLPSGDFRSYHVAHVLRCQDGDNVRAGIVDGRMGTATVAWVEGGDLKLSGFRSFGHNPPEPPPVDLLLAIPRPKVLERLLADIASIGVARLILCNAYRVERCYFDSTLLQDPSRIRRQLIEGLMQAGCDTRVPEVTITRRLGAFLAEELAVFSKNELRILAHPCAGALTISTFLSTRVDGRILIAIGPEGGWTDREVNMFVGTYGFSMAGLGDRVLRVDTACVASLSLIQSHLAESRVFRDGRVGTRANPEVRQS